MEKELTIQAETGNEVELHDVQEFASGSLDTCESCGKEINRRTDTYREHDGETYCLDCFDEQFFICVSCGEITSRDEGTACVDGDLYCEACADENLFFCEQCEEHHLQDDEVVVYYQNQRTLGIEEKTVCDSCADAHYTRCEDCGTRWRSSDTIHTGYGYDICPTCYESENDYGSCDCCNEVFHTDNLFYNERTDSIRCEACHAANGGDGEAINDYYYKPTPKFHHFNQATAWTIISRRPGNRLYLGSEIEVESPQEPANAVAQDIIDKFDDGEDWFYCKHDSSLDDGFEIVSHPFTLRAHKTQNYSDLFESLKSAGCMSHDTRTCGLHVHVSKDFFTTSELVKLGLFVYFHKTKLETFARRKETSFAKFKPLNRSDYLESAQSNRRYEAINFEPHTTVEFRLFRGTLNLETYLATLEFCDAVSRFVKTISAVCIAGKDGDSWEKFESFVKSDGNRKHYKNLIAYAGSKGLF